jgi:maltose alpha-D-glucosyltransferase/alpha-amylase
MGAYEFLASEVNAVLTLHRSLNTEDLICILNLTDQPQSVQLDLSRWDGAEVIDLLTEEVFPTVTAAPYPVTLKPWAFHWLKLAPEV